MWLQLFNAFNAYNSDESKFLCTYPLSIFMSITFIATVSS